MLSVRRVLALALLVAKVSSQADPAHAFRWPWEGSPWSTSSSKPVVELRRPSLEACVNPSETFRFAVWGDQRALADGEWQEMVERVAERHSIEPISFLVDTGDIVENGHHSNQFHELLEILEPVRDIPYLVGIGNHELNNNRTREARENTAKFLRLVAPGIAVDRLYYRKDLGAATFFFLDSNDWIYGEEGHRSSCPHDLAGETRCLDQLSWFVEELERGHPDDLRIVVMHHPIVQSSKKHLKASRSVWNATFQGRSLPQLFSDGGVDVVLTGHTHTYEHLEVRRRSDDHLMHVVNVSGRPRDAFLWIGAGSRRARDIRGREHEWLAENEFEDLDSFMIEQRDFMPKDDEANQFAIFTLTPEGRLSMQPHFLDDDEFSGLRTTDEVLLHTEQGGVSAGN